jgi:glycosyltransferase involved in cell wall biosynthesis
MAVTVARISRVFPFTAALPLPETGADEVRVLFITSAYPAHVGDPRGTFVHELARSLVAEGVAVTVLSPGAPGAPGREERDGVRIQRARYWVNRWQGLAVGLGGIVPNLRRKPWLVLQVPSLVWALAWHALRLGRHTDLIHAHWVYPAGIAGLLAAKWHRKPLVLTSHGGDLNLAAKVAPLRAMAAFVAKRANRCLGVSEAMVQRFLRLGVPASRVRHVPLGVSEPPPYADGQEAIPRGAAEFARHPGLKVVYAGSLVPRKSVHTLLEAQQALIARGKDIACMIVGTGPCEPRLQAIAARASNARVVFVGEQPPEHVPGYLRLADVLVLPSRSEGLGLVLVQAMILGKVVVASDIEGPRELIEDGVTGLLFPAGDSDALAEGLLSLIAAPDWARTLGERGRAAVLAEGRTLRASASAHKAIYDQLVGTTPWQVQ